jgi:predicted aminopeptidase
MIQPLARPRKKTLAQLLMTLLMAPALSGCSPSYVIRAAYEQSKILLARRPIEEVIQDPKTPQDERTKLAYVLQARTHATAIGLQTGESFTAYADVGKDTLAWVVVGSRKDAFALYSWWFPIVGTVPYKGFFNKDSAEKQVASLHAKGYETSMRGTEAFSTLGWFNDPILSTTLRNSVPRIVSTVIHESVHSTVWIRGSVPFNETLASFVGSQATVEFFAKQLTECTQEEPRCALMRDSHRIAEQEHKFQRELADAVTLTYRELSTLYNNPGLSSQEKIAQRSAVFERSLAPFRAAHPQMKILREVNNADLVQFTIYLTELPLFEQLYQKSEGSWERFFTHIREIQATLEKDPTKEPFKELKNLVYSETNELPGKDPL